MDSEGRLKIESWLWNEVVILSAASLESSTFLRSWVLNVQYLTLVIVRGLDGPLVPAKLEDK